MACTGHQVVDGYFIAQMDGSVQGRRGGGGGGWRGREREGKGEGEEGGDGERGMKFSKTSWELAFVYLVVNWKTATQSSIHLGVKLVDQHDIMEGSTTGETGGVVRLPLVKKQLRMS